MVKTVFISHSHQDRVAGQKLRELLGRAIRNLDFDDIRLTCDPASGLQIGDFVNRTILSDIRGCKAFFALLSPAYFESQYCIAEFYARLGAAGESKVLAFHFPGMEPSRFGVMFRDIHTPSLADRSAVRRCLCDLMEQVAEWEMRNSDEWEHLLEALCATPPVSGTSELCAIRSELVTDDLGAPFLNAYGLRAGALREDGLFQDFVCKGRNVEPVQYLWADSRAGGWIRTRLSCSPPFLTVEFENRGLAGCNVSIRPRDEMALAARGVSTLLIDARVAEESELQEIGVVIRMVNGLMQHWVLNQNAQDALLMRVSAKDFGSPLRVNLRDAVWHAFSADGTLPRGAEAPDFSIVASMNLSLGGYREFAHEPAPGKGILDLREIRCE